MSPIARIIEQAKRDPRRIALPEGEDERVLRAAEKLVEEGIARPVLVGDEGKLRSLAEEIGCSLEGVEIVDPSKFPRMDEYVARYVEGRPDASEKVARRLMRRPLYFAAMMVKAGDCDGMVGGVASITAAVIRAAGLVIGLREGFSIPSSFFIMHIEGCPYGENGSFIYADAGVNVDPSPQELAEIAIASAQSARELLGWEPRVAMLSFSTKGSAAHPLVDKVLEALKIAKEKAPDLMIDGEFQADAAIVPEIAKRKVKEESPVAGRANVLIFPDLNSGNIAYKLTQYLAGAEAYGPIFQGFSKPVNDLSRGASVQDIIGVVAVTVVQAQRQA